MGNGCRLLVQLLQPIYLFFLFFFLRILINWVELVLPFKLKPLTALNSQSGSNYSSHWLKLIFQMWRLWNGSPNSNFRFKFILSISVKQIDWVECEILLFELEPLTELNSQSGSNYFSHWLKLIFQIWRF